MLLWSLSVLLTAIVATASAQSYGELRLVQNGVTSRSYKSGRLEIFINGQWGTVCDDFFSFTDANVACRQLGYTGASSSPIAASSNSLFGSGSSSQQIWLDNVACQNSSLQHILTCSHLGIGVENCEHSEDVAVFCSSTSISDSPSFLQVRLVNGSYPSQGRVEVYCGGQWGTICEVEHNVGQNEADAICRQLGYTHASSYNTLTNLRTAPSQQPIWLGSGFSCHSDATNITRCTDAPSCGLSDEQVTSPSRCFHSNDVVVQCDYSGTYGELRLVQGTSTDSSYMSGRVEIFIGGQWGTICDDFWGQTESDVACQQLGYSRASQFGDAALLGFGEGTGQIWLDDVRCSSSDSSIIGCSHRGIGSHNCGHSEDISVSCVNTAAGTSVVGIAIGCSFGAICLIITCVFCVGAGRSHSSSRRSRRPVATTTAAVTTYPTTTATAATTTTTEVGNPGTVYPTTVISPYPLQPPSQPGAYPTQPTAYPGQGQEPPPPYPGLGFEMQPTAPQPQAAYPPAGYPPAGYPQQPYPTQAPGPAYPPASYPGDPNQPAPYPGQPSPYPSQPAPYPSQPAPHPSQPAHVDPSLDPPPVLAPNVTDPNQGYPLKQ